MPFFFGGGACLKPLALLVIMAAETPGVIFRGLFYQNKFLSQSAPFLARVWDFSASCDLLWASRSWSSRRKVGAQISHTVMFSTGVTVQNEGLIGDEKSLIRLV